MDAISSPPPHSISVRGFLAGIVRKKLGLKLVSQKDDGERVYRIMSGKFPRSESNSTGQAQA